jgi:hypothetical protein
MEIDRRRVLIGGACAALTGAVGTGGFVLDPVTSAIPGSGLWHPLTRLLLERARRASRCTEAPDRGAVERAVRAVADASGRTGPLVIKWMDSPADAHDHLSRLGLEALLHMGSATFWRGAEPHGTDDAEALEHAFAVRMLADDIVGAEQCDRMLMAPKLRAKAQAVSAKASDRELFRVRAIAAQIGWLETSLAYVAAQAVSNVELLLRDGASEGSVAIDNQLRTFESYDRGLLATWETPGALICVLRTDVSSAVG